MLYNGINYRFGAVTGIQNANTTGKIAADVDASAVQNQLTIIGNNGSNQLTGTEFDDTLVGNGGNDVKRQLLQFNSIMLSGNFGSCVK